MTIVMYLHRIVNFHLSTGIRPIRESFNSCFADKLTCIIKAAAENEIDFVYALSPGLDVIYSSEEDLQTIQAKLEQVSHVRLWK